MGGVALVTVFQFISATAYFKSCMFTFGVGAEAQLFFTELNWLTELRIRIIHIYYWMSKN